MVRAKLKETINIVTDSSCDLPQQLLTRFKIAIVPLSVSFGTDTYADGQLTAEAFWEKASEADTPPKTSQPSPGVFEEIFKQLVEQGKQVLYITLTGRHSGTADTARSAAERMGGAVEVFDSQSLSLGQGFQALEAARAAQSGLSMQEIVSLLEDLRSRIHVMVVLDTLDNLRRGGRADRLIVALDRIAQTLNIKPIVNFVEGQVQLLGIARSFRHASERILSMVEKLGPLERLAVAHARNWEKAEELADRLSERLNFPREKILIQETGAVVASHAGPRAIGVFAVSRQSGDKL